MAQTEQFTPGPWTVGEAQSGEIAIVADGVWVIAVKHGALYHPKGEANARLIAAAPDLLSIVERFVALPSGAWHPERHAADEAELMTEAKAAIAKARGEQP